MLKLLCCITASAIDSFNIASKYMKSIVEVIFLHHFCVYLCNIIEIAGVITLAREVHTRCQFYEL